MTDEAADFQPGDRVVLINLGPDQPEGVVLERRHLRTYPGCCTFTVAFESGERLVVGPYSLRPASERASMPLRSRYLPEPSLPFASSPEHRPLLAPDWEIEDLSESALAEAIGDWEKVVGYFESGYDYYSDFDEYDHDMFSRECVHVFLEGFARLAQPLPEALTARLAKADQRFMALTVENHYLKPARDYDPVAFWYYFRWPRVR